MASSRFSSPFFQKSPLQGAYSSGADGLYPISYDDVQQKFQSDIANNVAKAYAPKENACSNLDQKLADGTLREGAHKVLSEKCAKKNKPEEESIDSKLNDPNRKPHQFVKTPNLRPENPYATSGDQIAAEYGETPPSKSTGPIPEINSIFNNGMVHQNHPCPPGQSRDPVTGMCGL